MPAQVLDREREAACRLLPALIPAHEGRWGVFHGDGLVAIHDTFDGAMTFAYGKYTPGEFLVVEICDDPDPIEGEEAA